MPNPITYIPYVFSRIIEKIRYRCWVWRIHYGWDITMDVDASATVILSSFNEQRIQNIEPIVRGFLKCRFIEKVIVTNNNPEINIYDWVQLDDSRIQLINQPFRRRAGFRWFLAKEETAQYFLAVDDDLFIFPGQLRKLFGSLIQQPEVPHGLAGSIYKSSEKVSPGDLHHSYYRRKEMEVDVLHEVYAVTMDHVKTYFKYFEMLKEQHGLSSDIFYSSDDLVMLAYGDDILISHGGGARPRIHDCGNMLGCPTALAEGVALWQGEGFTERRLKILDSVKENWVHNG